jgi:hypothetical protein
MISSWKEFWLSEQKIYIVLCLAGILVGLITGTAVAGWSEYFPPTEIFNKYQIPALISFGIVAGFAVQLVSVLLIWIVLNWNSKLYNLLVCALFTIPFGILVIFNILSDRLVSFGFICSYIPDLLIFPLGLIMIIIGMDATCFLAINALCLLPFYIVSTGVVWLLELSRSIV